jgi:hypothetical protein
MARPQRYTVEDLRTALASAHGQVYGAAERLGCDPQTVYNYLARYPELQGIVEEARGLRMDRAEQQLDRAVEQGQPWAIKLTLLTLGKERGYSPRTEHAHGVQGPLTVEVVEYRDGGE